MDKLELYYNHYKETYSLCKEAQLRRNRNYMVLCILEALSFLFLIKPDTVLEIFKIGINARLNTTLTFGNNILQTLLWILIAYIMIKYCQDTLYVERQYVYLDEVEKEISQIIGNGLFGREGERYLKDYPIILNFIDLFYKMFSPILFMIINVAHIISEWKVVGTFTLALVCNTIIFTVIVIVTWFYFFEIHSKITAWCKQHLPLIDKTSKWLRKVLKEV